MRRWQTRVNEEIKIVIKAITDSAKKQIKQVSKELDEVSKNSGKASSGFDKSMKSLAAGAKKAAVAVAAVVAVIGTMIMAIANLGKKTLEYNKEQAKLVAGFQSVGASAQQATETYNGLFRFLGESDRAVEAANHLARLTTNQQHLAEWTKIAQGVYAVFGDSLPIEGLTEAANETARVGKVVGTLADALNWAGVSEDEFNARLARTNSLSEREALLRSTLNGLYSDAAEIYEKNNKAILDYNESQSRLNAAMGAAGAATMPLLTALNNLGTAFFNALKPALDVIVPALATFVNWVAKAVETITAFFSALTGKSTKIKAVSNISTGMGSGLGSAAGGANDLASGLDNAAGSAKEAEKAIEDAKKATLGFDELNIVPSGKTDSGSSGGSGGGGGSSSPGYGGGGGAGGMADFATEVEESEEGANRFEKIFEKISNTINKLKTVFAPTIKAWSDGFETIKKSVKNAIPHVLNGLEEFREGLVRIGGYLVNEFVPDVVNSFSVNLAPLITDTLGFAIEEVALDFEYLGSLFNRVSEDVIVPALELVKTVSTGLFESIGSAWAEHGEPFINKLSQAFENVRETLDGLYEQFVKPILDKVIKKLDEVWTEGLKPLVDEFLDAAFEIGECLLDLYNEFIHPIAMWLLDEIYPIVAGVIEDIIDIVGDILIDISNVIEGVIKVIKGIVQFITGVFTLDWKKAWEGIQNIFGGVWDVICGIAEAAWDTIRLIFEPAYNFFKGIWESIKETYAEVEEWFEGVFSDAWEAIEDAWDSAVEWFEDIWEDIEDVFEDVDEWFEGKFEDAWEAIKDVFDDWGSFFSGLWKNIQKTFSNLGTQISTAISGSVKAGINSMISQVESSVNRAIGLINSAIRLANKIPGVNISGLNTVSLPRLATGGIVNSATIAMIGEAGKEAVLPLENNTQWMDRLAEKIAGMNNTQAPTRIILKVGERELGMATIDSINKITKQTGGLQLQLI